MSARLVGKFESQLARATRRRSRIGVLLFFGSEPFETPPDWTEFDVARVAFKLVRRAEFETGISDFGFALYDSLGCFQVEAPVRFVQFLVAQPEVTMAAPPDTPYRPPYREPRRNEVA